MESRIHMKNFIIIFIFSILLGLSGCSSKPNIAECGKYYQHLLQLGQSGLKGMDAAMRTSEGKAAVIRYCLNIKKKQVECVLKAPNTSDAAACEAEDASGFFGDWF